MATSTESFPWRCLYCHRLNKKTHEECPTCSSHWSTGQKHNVEPKSKVYHEENTDWENWHEDWHGDQRWGSRSPSRQRAQQDQYAQQVQSPRQRSKGQGQKGKSAKGKNFAKGKGRGKMPAGEQSSPFQNLPAPNPDSWTAFDSTGFMPSSMSSGNPFQLANTEGGMQEMAAALRRAYPEKEKAPEDVQALLEKADQETARLGLKNLHQAAKHLDRSKKQLKDINDQRKAHRSTWLKHVTEGIQMWEKQLEEFRRHQATLTDLAGRAQSEISTTSRAIQLLGAAGSGAAMPSIPVQDTSETVDQAEETTDQEEEKLRLKLQTVLKACASSLGIAAVSPTQIDIKSDEEKEVGQKDEKPPKRPRSLEPFGGQPTS